MAQITICDLCKTKVDKCLSIRISETKGEFCSTCCNVLVSVINGDVPLNIQKPVKNTFVDEGSVLISPEPSSPVLLKKTIGQPTETLLDGELQRLPSKVDIRAGSEDLKNLNKKNNGCPHYYKTYNGNKPICADAQPGINGPYANFKGCGKILSESEL